ncbi:MAG TPA: energy transducer TonB [Pyrinomonadaceae bacterium]|nr:energy transducer TonB [Pyrinomonadaceae bacterium]
MRQVSISSIALCLVLSAAFQLMAQEKKASTPPAASESEQPKSEVELMLEDAKKHGEPILGVCVQDCGEKSDQDIQGLEKGRALELPKPPYPAIARAAHASGQVQVRVIIDVDGKVIAASAIDGHPLLYGVSVQAARESLFTPTKVNGTPVKVLGVIAYNFIAQ